MKKTTILRIAFLSYIVCGIALYLCADVYLDKKDRRLKRDAINNLQECFSLQNQYVSVRFSGRTVHYEQISVPDYHLNGIELPSSKKKWGDVYKLYETFSLIAPAGSGALPSPSSGWMFDIIEKVSDDCFRKSRVYPYRIGYRKQNNSWAYNYMPTIQEAIDEAYDYYTSNDNSEFVKYLVPGNDLLVYDIRKAVDNEYYYCFSYDEMVKKRGQHAADSIMMFTDWQKFGDDGSYHIRGGSEYGYMYNDYYKVYNYFEDEEYYQIKYRFPWDPKADDMKSILIWGYSILSFLLLCFVIPLSVFILRKKKERTEPLKEKLLRVCNPSRFMKPYDETKIDSANDLYERISMTSEDDIEELRALRRSASQSLGINFIDSELLKDLLALANPKKYTKPYDAEKIRCANYLYSRLMSECLDVDELEEIQNEINNKLVNSNKIANTTNLSEK